MSEKFICLNSFPKSGNTWVRTVLSHLCFDGTMTAIPDRYKFDIFEAPRFETADGTRVRFYKSHDWKLERKVNDQLLSHAAAVHIIRHPLDVFLSYLNFLHLDKSQHPVPKSKGKPDRAPFCTNFNSIAEIEGRNLIWAYFGAFLVYGTLAPRFKAAGSWWDNAEYWSSNEVPCAPVFRIRVRTLVSEAIQGAS